MAGVAKWLRQWFVVPPFVGSSPIVRPYPRYICLWIHLVSFFCLLSDRCTRKKQMTPEEIQATIEGLLKVQKELQESQIKLQQMSDAAIARHSKYVR